jgi:hypothetical protein
LPSREKLLIGDVRQVIRLGPRHRSRCTAVSIPPLDRYGEAKAWEFEGSKAGSSDQSKGQNGVVGHTRKTQPRTVTRFAGTSLLVAYCKIHQILTRLSPQENHVYHVFYRVGGDGHRLHLESAALFSDTKDSNLTFRCPRSCKRWNRGASVQPAYVYMALYRLARAGCCSMVYVTALDVFYTALGLVREPRYQRHCMQRLSHVICTVARRAGAVTAWSRSGHLPARPTAAFSSAALAISGDCMRLFNSLYHMTSRIQELENLGFEWDCCSCRLGRSF